MNHDYQDEKDLERMNKGRIELSFTIDSLRRAIWQRADEAGGLLIASCGEENSVVTGQNFLAKMASFEELLTSKFATVIARGAKPQTIVCDITK
jgi:hypothetical protein